jgi:diaminopimelate epimerase
VDLRWFQLYIATMVALKFIKMHGLGNDFVVFDARNTPIELTALQTQSIADRHRGIGCDQVILLENARSRGDVMMRIYNSDGGEVEACGNATRCIGGLIMEEKGSDQATIETLSGLLIATKSGSGICVDMGPAYIKWDDIPLATKMDTLSLNIKEGALSDPVAVGLGNPHAVFFVDNVAKIDLNKIGPVIEHHKFYPKRTNVEVAQVTSRTHIRLRVWERGVGITQACGTGACATLVAAVRRNLTECNAIVELDGGPLEIEWRNGKHIFMTGPTEMSFAGTWVL